MANFSVDETSAVPDDQLGRHLPGPIVMVTIVVVSLIVVVGTVACIAAIFVVVRRRLWRLHEGYLYLLAIFVAGLFTVLFVLSPRLLLLFRSRFLLETSSDFACKIQHFLSPVSVSGGWFVVALLLGVFLRGQIVRRSIVFYRTFSNKYCTVLGSIIVIVVISICFSIMNCWTLWTFKMKSLDRFNSSNSSGETVYICDTAGSRSLYLNYIWSWEIPTEWIMLFVPVAIVLPVLWALVLWSYRKHNVAFSFFALSAVDPNSEDRDFARLSVIIGAAVFLIQFPRILTEIFRSVLLDGQLYLIYILAHLFFLTYVVVTPLCCFCASGHMRKDLTVIYVSKCCCRRSVTANVGDNDDDESDNEAPGLSLDSIQSTSDAGNRLSDRDHATVPIK